MIKPTKRTIEVARESLEFIRNYLDNSEYETYEEFANASSAYWKLRNFVSLVERNLESEEEH